MDDARANHRIPMHRSSRLPESGTIADLVPRLTRFVDARKHGWSSRVRGATPQELGALEDALGLPALGMRLPESYRRTLACFGREDDGLLAKLRYRYGAIRSVAQLIVHHRELADEGPDPWQPVVLGSEIGDCLAFDLRAADDAHEAPVVHEGTTRVFAESWEKLLFQHVVGEADVYDAEAVWWSSASPNALQAALMDRPGATVHGELAEVAARHALVSAWFDDAQHRYLSCESLSASVSLHHGIYFVVSGYDEPARALAETLAQRFGARVPQRLAP